MKMAKEEAAEKKKRSEKDETFVEEEQEEKAAERGGGGGGGKTVVVGVRMDSQSRELLTWALVKAAASGDLVVALHVLSSSGGGSAAAAKDPGGQPVAVLSVAKELDAMLAVYEGFCNLKQIDLKLKICKGSSIRKVLVKEAKAFAASLLILGVTKNSRAIGSSWVSIAKHCAKKLPNDCSVVALSDGKIVFQREAADNNRSQKKSSNDPTEVDENNDLFCLFPIVGPKKLNDTASDPSFPPEAELNGCIISHAANGLSASNGSPRSNCSICAPESDPSSLNELKEEESLDLVPVEKTEAPTSSTALTVVKDLPEARPGWPSLRRLVLTNRKSLYSEKHKASVVQWAKWLPSRYSSVHPDRKSKKSEGNTTLNLDQESGAIVPVGADLPPTPFLPSDAEGRLPEELESFRKKFSSVCRLFSYEELEQATSNFLHENLIGKGGSSSVYKGCLSDGKELAVKILKPSEDAVKDFVSEIEIITTLHHKNIIALLGFCFQNNSLMLVYDYLSRGSLEEILHGEEVNKHVLGWAERYKVAIGVAEALDYLHGGGTTEPVIHRDVKSSNILLSDDFEPQLSDFGLAKWASASSQLICSDVAGTFGYLAPEYILYGKVNEKVDVYAFGVVLLELLSGRKPISSGCPKGQESLLMWAKPILQDGDTKQLIDPGLKNEFSSDQVERMILAASLCARRLHHARPHITLVLKLLQGDNDTVEWARSEVNARADMLDDEMPNQESDIQSHLNLALLDVKDDLNSISSTDHTSDSLTSSASAENYLQWRCSHSSSFD
ncbi:probable receptor-like serine/threonine-protein kinase At5g57670 isoform X1 [Musa acuminata AAA Group]|uniref:probable receptor-like serine/threonine-protein kinase At5g57670 isoform X1 n=1 Tax=Musa acuminata AAA Group TaxID=214697 RepID=UPI0031D711E2